MNEQLTYNICRVCGLSPDGMKKPMNHAAKRWWDCDDGWKVGDICDGCWQEVKDVKPSPSDYAYDSQKDKFCSGDIESDVEPDWDV